MKTKKTMKSAWIATLGLLLSAATCSQWGGLSGDETFDRQDQCADALGCDDGNPCSVDTCDPTTTTCTHEARADGTNVDAEPLDCKLYVCESGVVRVSPANDDVSCKVDGLQGKCNNGECVTECVTEADPVCDDQNPCTDDACNLEIGQCGSTNKANGEPSGVVEECRVHTCQSGADSSSAEPKGTSCTTCDTAPCVCDNGGSCVTQTCTDDLLNGTETDVDCGGSVCLGCVNGLICQVDADCLSNFCDEGLCQPCVSHDECGADEQCDLVVGSCIPKSDDGTECDEVENCVSGFCVDGVCCDTECDGTCEACTSLLRGDGAVAGKCGAIQAGDDPELECKADECKTGACDGNSACGHMGAGTLCGDQAQCSGNTAIFGDTCDDQGQCADAGLQGCGSYVCTPGPVCLTSCMDDSDCFSSNDYCDVSQCVQKKDDGQSSTDPTECKSGYASDGVCCASACGAKCMACSKQKTGVADGTCAPVTAGTNPDGECGGTCTSTCNGSGVCLDAAGTVCGASSCDQATSTYNPVHTCNGATCVPGTPQTCGLYGCSVNGCKPVCLADADCGPTAKCFNPGPAGVCKLKEGQSCGADGTVCASGNCADGFCCDLSCGNTCRSCNQLGFEGTCLDVPKGYTDSYASSGSVCDSSSTPPSACDGTSSTVAGNDPCKKAATQNCTTDAECASDFCTGQVVKKCKSLTGVPCVSGPECASGSCVSNFCATGASGTPCLSNTDCTSANGCNTVSRICN